MPLSPDELSTLVSTIDVLNTEVSGLRTAMINADKRARWARSVAIVGVVAGIIGGAVGLGGVIVGANARATGEDLARDRRASQISGCVQSNLQTDNMRKALVAGVEVLTAPDPRRSEADQARVDRFFTEYSTSVRSKLPFRDCSRRGIDLFYANPPVDPALGEPTTTTTTRGG